MSNPLTVLIMSPVMSSPLTDFLQVSPSTGCVRPPWWGWPELCLTWRRTPGSGPPPASGWASSPSLFILSTPSSTLLWIIQQGTGCPTFHWNKNYFCLFSRRVKNCNDKCYEAGACRKYIGGVPSSDWVSSTQIIHNQFWACSHSPFLSQFAHSLYFYPGPGWS